MRECKISENRVLVDCRGETLEVENCNLLACPGITQCKYYDFYCFVHYMQCIAGGFTVTMVSAVLPAERGFTSGFLLLPKMRLMEEQIALHLCANMSLMKKIAIQMWIAQV